MVDRGALSDRASKNQIIALGGADTLGLDQASRFLECQSPTLSIESLSRITNSSVLTSKIRIRQLRCCVDVARKKSIVLATQDLGLTQPAVSRGVRELEQ